MQSFYDFEKPRDIWRPERNFPVSKDRVRSSTPIGVSFNVGKYTFNEFSEIPFYDLENPRDIWRLERNFPVSKDRVRNRRTTTLRTFEINTS